MINGSLLRSTALVLHYVNQQLEPLSNATPGDDVNHDAHLAFLDRLSLFFIVGDNVDAAAVSAQVTQDHINAVLLLDQGPCTSVSRFTTPPTQTARGGPSVAGRRALYAAKTHEKVDSCPSPYNDIRIQSARHDEVDGTLYSSQWVRCVS
jgi:hypothetical protein